METKKTADLIKSSRHIGLIGHVNADADCYGAMFGLAGAISALGKKVTLFSGEDFPDNLDFLFYYFQGQIESIQKEDVDLLVILDTPAINRINSEQIFSFYKDRATNILVIDHHNHGDLYNIDNFNYFTKTEVSSTSELVFDVIKDLNIKIDKNIATTLLAGIISDTSSFTNQNTFGSTFEVSSELMAHGARLKIINKNLFGSKDVDVLKLWGLAMNRLYHNKKWGIVSTYLSYRDIQECGISVEALSGIINFLNSVKGARMIVLITEEEEGKIKVSFRTRDEKVNVARLAAAFGGGGHNKAAAFKFSGRLNINNNGVSIQS
jgi:phosphoesterase RecJ-like protein